MLPLLLIIIMYYSNNNNNKNNNNNNNVIFGRQIVAKQLWWISPPEDSRQYPKISGWLVYQRILMVIVLAGWSYLSGVRLGLWRFEEGVRQFPHPHGDRGGYNRTFRVHYGVEKRLQISLGITPNMDDLVAGRGIVLARIHSSKDCKKVLSRKMLLG